MTDLANRQKPLINELNMVHPVATSLAVIHQLLRNLVPVFLSD